MRGGRWRGREVEGGSEGREVKGGRWREGGGGKRKQNVMWF